MYEDMVMFDVCVLKVQFCVFLGRNMLFFLYICIYFLFRVGDNFVYMIFVCLQRFLYVVKNDLRFGGLVIWVFFLIMKKKYVQYKNGVIFQMYLVYLVELEFYVVEFLNYEQLMVFNEEIRMNILLGICV